MEVDYGRIPIEIESPEEVGYGNIRYNLSESSIADQSLADLGLTLPDIKLIYGEHRGSTKLRELVAAEGAGLAASDVLITNGAAMALFIISTSLLTPRDHLIVVRPNYGLNLETPRAIGCEVTHFDLTFDEAFRIDVDKLAASIRPNTKVISLTVPHNPTGIMFGEADLGKMADIARQHGCYLVVDETYRNLTFEGLLPVAATLGPHVLSVSSMSKAYGIPGTRIGWLISTDKALQEKFLGAKEQICICGSILDEWIAEQVMAHKERYLGPIMEEMRRRLKTVSDWIATEDLLEWNRPAGGVVAFVRMKKEPPGGTEAFYNRLMNDHGTYVARGRWFYLPDTYFRLGFGWSTAEELKRGLACISLALRS
jgi:aspartate/methionine/tyrosine aminotransferase